MEYFQQSGNWIMFIFMILQALLIIFIFLVGCYHCTKYIIHFVRGFRREDKI